MAAVPGSAIKLRNESVALPSVVNHKRNVCRGGRAARFAAYRRAQAVSLESQFLGAKLRASERVQRWRIDGPGRSPKLRVVSPSMALSQVPEKPLGLYDPSFDKDSCGVGFVAELSGEYSRKTVCLCSYLYAILCLLKEIVSVDSILDQI